MLRLCHGLAGHCSTARIGPLPHLEMKLFFSNEKVCPRTYSVEIWTNNNVVFSVGEMITIQNLKEKATKIYHNLLDTGEAHWDLKCWYVTFKTHFSHLREK